MPARRRCSRGSGRTPPRRGRRRPTSRRPPRPRARGARGREAPIPPAGPPLYERRAPRGGSRGSPRPCRRPSRGGGGSGARGRPRGPCSTVSVTETVTGSLVMTSSTLADRGVDAVTDRAEEIALAHHADQPALRVEHGRGSHIGSVEDHRRLRQGDGVGHHHRRLVHHVRDGQGGGHALSLALCVAPLDRRASRARERTGAPERHDLARHDRRAALPTGDMDPEAYRRAARRVADWVADYLRDVELYPVLSPRAAGNACATPCPRRRRRRASRSRRCSATSTRCCCPRPPTGSRRGSWPTSPRAGRDRGSSGRPSPPR